MTAVDSLQAAIEQLAREPNNENAWRLLYRQIWPLVVAIAFRRVKDRFAAEDVAQQVLLGILRARPFETIREEGRFRAYIWRMTINAANSRMRSAKREARFEQAGIDAESVMPQGGDPTEDERLLLEEALALAIGEGLSAEDRELLELLMQGRSLGEAASACNLSYSAAGVRYFRIKQKLHKILKYKDK